MKNKIQCFGEYERWTPEGQEADQALHAALKPVMESLVRKGYAIRDVEYIANKVVLDISLCALLQAPSIIAKEPKP